MNFRFGAPLRSSGASTIRLREAKKLLFVVPALVAGELPMFCQSWCVWRAIPSSEWSLVTRHGASEIAQLVAGIGSLGVIFEHLDKTLRVCRQIPASVPDYMRPRAERP